MDPIDVLCRIVDADREARERAEAALQEKNTFDTRLEQLSGAMADSALQRVNSELENAREQSKAALTKELDAIDSEHRARLADMQRHFDDNRDAYIDAVFRMAAGLT